MTRRSLFLACVILFLGAGVAFPDELRCEICGRAITPNERYYRTEDGNHVFCERCFATAPRCSLCKLPTAPELIDPRTGACPRCLAKLPRCKACGRAIAGALFRFPDVEGVFCAECKKNRPACYICGAPVGADYWQYPDGRTVCNECTRRAVLDMSAIKAIMKDAQSIIERQLGLGIKIPYTLHVERLGGTSSYDPEVPRERDPSASLYGKELGMYRRTGDKSEIFLLFGLPPEMLYETAAHEYAHAWQADNGLTRLGPELREGFAQWVAAEVLRVKGYRGALQKLEARADSPYGTGYQRLRTLHRQTVLQLLRERR